MRTRTFIGAAAVAVGVAAACTGGGVSGPASSAADSATSDGAGQDTAAKDGTAGLDASPASDTATGGSDTGSGGGDAAPGDSDTGSGGGDTAVAGSIPLEQFASAVAEATCAAIAKCSLGWQFSSLAACKSFYEFAAQGEGGDINPAALVKAGKATYDPVAAAKCIAEITKSCNPLKKKIPAACAQMIKGTTKDGSPCDGSSECASGWCNKAAKPNCPGVCTPAADLGGACDGNDACKGDLTCNGLKCGQPTGGKAGAACSPSSCDAGLWCKDPDGPASSCTALGDLGTACDKNQPSCKAGLWCAEAAGGETKCVAQAKIGEACPPVSGSAGPFGVQAGPCPAGARCVMTAGKVGGATCMPVVKQGEACTAEGQCSAIDLTCAGAASGKGQCTPLPGAGESCTPPNFFAGQFFSCALPLFCDEATKKCGPAPKAGQPCLLICDGDLKCVSGTCALPAKAGEPCDDDNACSTGLTCVDGKCAAPVCR